MPDLKTCKQCGDTKPLSDYYEHPEMADGHLNKCKECKCANQREVYDKRSQNPEWMEKERRRTRKKHHRLNYGEKYSWDNLTEKQKQRRIKQSREYRKRYREKQNAHNHVHKNMNVPDGKEAHHWSYNREHFGDVILLSHGKHMELHRHLEYDEEAKMYRTPEGRLLDTREKHTEYAKNVLDESSVVVATS